MTTKKEKVMLRQEVTLDSLAYSIADDCSHEAVLKFIKTLDGLMEDYDFTKKLRDYFIKEIEEEDA
jgi:hypothetical protein